MRLQFKSGIVYMAIFAIVLMTSCSKESILPIGILGDPNDPSNGTMSTMPYSSDLGRIQAQRQSFTDHDETPTGRNQTKITLIASQKKTN